MSRRTRHPRRRSRRRSSPAPLGVAGAFLCLLAATLLLGAIAAMFPPLSGVVGFLFLVVALSIWAAASPGRIRRRH